MLVHPQFDPVAVHLGPLAVRWYGLDVSDRLRAGLGVRPLRNPGRAPHAAWTTADLDDALFYGILGTILGGRLGYVLFYKFGDYLDEPWRIFYVWEGGMSFHGGFLGVIIALAWYAHTHRQSWLAIIDFIAPLVPLGLGGGRIGNFINAELWGRASDVPWAMIFPNVDRVPRHPSQLYEFALEGVVLVCYCCGGMRRNRGRAARCRRVFLIGYGVFRFASNSRASPTVFSACSRSACRWGSGCRCR